MNTKLIKYLPCCDNYLPFNLEFNYYQTIILALLINIQKNRCFNSSIILSILFFFPAALKKCDDKKINIISLIFILTIAKKTYYKPLFSIIFYSLITAYFDFPIFEDICSENNQINIIQNIIQKLKYGPIILKYSNTKFMIFILSVFLNLVILTFGNNLFEIIINLSTFLIFTFQRILLPHSNKKLLHSENINNNLKNILNNISSFFFISSPSIKTLKNNSKLLNKNINDISISNIRKKDLKFFEPNWWKQNQLKSYSIKLIKLIFMILIIEQIISKKKKKK